MTRPRKYATVAEKHRAYRLRKKLRENEHPPELDQVAKLVHKIYKERAKLGLVNPENFVGKTPYETLLRVVVYEVLFTRHLPDKASYDYPPLHTLIMPSHGAAADLPSWIISPDNLTDEAASYVSVFDEAEEEEEDEDGNQRKA